MEANLPQRMQTENPTSDEEFARIQQMRNAAPEMYVALTDAAMQLGIQRLWIKRWAPEFATNLEYIGDAKLADDALAKALAVLAKAREPTYSPQAAAVPGNQP